MHHLHIDSFLSPHTSVARSAGVFRSRLPALQLRRSQGTLITVEGSNPGLSYQARREVAVNFTTD